jgi:hypothetical protein
MDAIFSRIAKFDSGNSARARLPVERQPVLRSSLKNQFYPTRRDEEAVNADGTRLR